MVNSDYWLRSLAKQGDNALGSVCLSVRPSIRQRKEQQPPLPVQGDCLCVDNQGPYADNHADAVDQLLIDMNVPGLVMNPFMIYL